MLRIFFSIAAIFFFQGLFAQDVVDTQLNDLQRQMANQGMSQLESRRYMHLRDDEDETISIQLRAGVNYRIWAAGDQDVEDLDLELTDAYGNQIDIDQATDNLPVISVNSPATGTYYLRAHMYECTIEPCRVGVGIFGANTSSTVSRNTTHGIVSNTGSAGNSSSPQGQVDIELANIRNNYVSGGFQSYAQNTYLWLNEDEEQTIPVNLNAYYAYQIWGSCDSDCGDLDFVLTDAYGNEVDADRLQDKHPLVNPTNPATATYMLRVKMYNCEVEPCRVGVAFYRR